MFLDPSRFDFVPALRERWTDIRREVLSLGAAGFEPWHETHLYDTGWDVFGLHAFGKRMPENCARVPITTAAVEAVPGLVTAGFSSLKPRTHIKPHVGYQYRVRDDGTLETDRSLNGTVLRLHLGLLVPESLTGIGCALRVGESMEAWREGECLVFDDTMQHEAWNNCETTRVVLLLDFKRPGAPS